MQLSAPEVRVRFPLRRSALASYRVTGMSLSLFVPTSRDNDVPLGADVRLVISFGDTDQTFALLGQVTWRRSHLVSATQETGLGVSFRGQEKYEAAQMLAFCAGKPLSLGTAGDERFPARLDCRIRLGTREIEAQVRDISSSGAFLASPRLAAAKAGAELTVVLRPGWFGLGRQAYEAKVIWSGDQKDVPGCGVRFVNAPGEAPRRGLKRYLVHQSARRRQV